MKISSNLPRPKVVQVFTPLAIPEDVKVVNVTDYNKTGRYKFMVTFLADLSQKGFKTTKQLASVTSQLILLQSGVTPGEKFMDFPIYLN